MQNNERSCDAEELKVEALLAFCRTLIRRKVITRVRAHLRQNEFWKELVPLEEERYFPDPLNSSPLMDALKLHGIRTVSEDIGTFVEDARIVRLFAGINPKYIYCLLAYVLMGMEDGEIGESLKLSKESVRTYRSKTVSKIKKKEKKKDE